MNDRNNDGASSESEVEVLTVSRRWGNHSLFVNFVHSEIPEFDPGIFRLKSEHAINELLSSTVLTTRKIQLDK